MSKIELTVSPNYVPSWTIVDAIRELFQNALDQQQQNPDNIAKWWYDENKETLYISNKTSKLTASSLLLGHTTKADDATTIGQFGEGYKIATLVLLRNNKQVTFYNYGAREIWRPRFVKSRKFGADILTFFIDKPKMWETVPSADLIIEIKGISVKEYMIDIAPSNLHIRADYNVVTSTRLGDVIDLPGQIFVNGLYVCTHTPYKYGYNFKPEHLKLDRDRKLVSDFDLMWLSSRVWSEATDMSVTVMDMVTRGEADVKYLEEVSTFRTHWRDMALETFVDTYGHNAIPVSTQEMLECVPQGYKGIVVPSNYSTLIRSSSKFEMPRLTNTPLGKLQEWFEGMIVKYNISEEDIQDFNNFLDAL